MQTKSLIQASANVIRITELTVGNTIKVVRMDYNSKPEIYYGVVLDLLNSGEKTFVQIALYKKNYSSIEAEIVTYAGDKEIELFPATPEEATEFLGSAVRGMRESFERKERELVEEQRKLESIEAFVKGEKAKKLTATSFTSLTQEDYNTLHKLKEGEE